MRIEKAAPSAGTVRRRPWGVVDGGRSPACCREREKRRFTVGRGPSGEQPAGDGAYAYRNRYERPGDPQYEIACWCPTPPTLARGTARACPSPTRDQGSMLSLTLAITHAYQRQYLACRDMSAATVSVAAGQGGCHGRDRPTSHGPGGKEATRPGCDPHCSPDRGDSAQRSTAVRLTATRRRRGRSCPFPNPFPHRSALRTTFHSRKRWWYRRATSSRLNSRLLSASIGGSWSCHSR